MTTRMLHCARGEIRCTVRVLDHPAIEIHPITSGLTVTHTSARNTLFNPPVIPILPAGGDEETAANLRVTRAFPTPLAEIPDAEVSWRAIPESLVTFIGSRNRKSVFVTGSGAAADATLVGGGTPGNGAVTFEATWRHGSDAAVATFRAYVRPLVHLRTRIILLEHADLPNPLNANAVLRHLLIANRYLRQVGVQLTPDTGPEMTGERVGRAGLAQLIDHAATRQLAAGVFKLRVRHRGLAKFRRLTGIPRVVMSLFSKADCVNLYYCPTFGYEPLPPDVVAELARQQFLVDPAVVEAHGASDPLAFAEGPAGNPGGPITEDAAPTSSWIAPNGLAHGSIASPFGYTRFAPEFWGRRDRTTQVQQLRDARGALEPMHTFPTGDRELSGVPTGIPAARITIQCDDAPSPFPGAIFAADATSGIGTSERRIGGESLGSAVAHEVGHAFAPSTFDGAPEEIMGSTMAHEVGHVLGLRHRGHRYLPPSPPVLAQGGMTISTQPIEDVGDGLLWPPWENLMYTEGDPNKPGVEYGLRFYDRRAASASRTLVTDTTEVRLTDEMLEEALIPRTMDRKLACQSLDTLQALVVRRSELLTSASLPLGTPDTEPSLAPESPSGVAPRDRSGRVTAGVLIAVLSPIVGAGIGALIGYGVGGGRAEGAAWGALIGGAAGLAGTAAGVAVAAT